MTFVYNETNLRLTLPRPDNYRAVLELAQAFVTYEQKQPLEQQTLLTERLTILQQQLSDSYKQAHTAESQRKAASEALKRTEKQARAILRQAHHMVAATFATMPVEAQRWGFIVRQTGRSAGRILLPHGRDNLLETLDLYIAAEQERLPAERFPIPPLNEVIALRDALQMQIQQRDKQSNRRGQAVERSTQLGYQTRKLLKDAVAYLLVTKCQGEICYELTAWGFQISQRGSKKTSKQAVPQ